MWEGAVQGEENKVLFSESLGLLKSTVAYHLNWRESGQCGLDSVQLYLAR